MQVSVEPITVSAMNLMADLAAALAAESDQRKDQLTVLWASIDPADHAARCIAAHYIADVQATLDDEVAWDELALREVINVSDADLQAINPTLSVAGFMPSLHLNLADGYRRQGKFEQAADHLATSREFDFALDTPEQQAAGYPALIREGQARVAAKIAAAERS